MAGRMSSTSTLTLQWIYYYVHSKRKELYAEIVKMPKDVRKFPEFLVNFDMKHNQVNCSRVIIDSSSSHRQRYILNAIRHAKFTQSRYRYIIANFDFLPHDVKVFGDNSINILGFQITNRDGKEYRSLSRSLHANSHKTDSEKEDTEVEPRAVFAYDAVLTVMAGLEATLRRNDSLFRQNFRHGELYNRGYPGIHCYPKLDVDNPQRSFTTFEHGFSISRALKGLRVDDGTLTGNIEFDRFGTRINFDVNVVEVISVPESSSVIRNESKWRQGVGFLSDPAKEQYTRRAGPKPYKGKIIKVITMITAPFVSVKNECENNANIPGCNGTDRYEGYCIDLLKLLKERIPDFNYEIYISNSFGKRQPDGSFDGAIGALLNGSADVCVASLTISEERQRVVEFTKPFMTTGISIMIRRPDSEEFRKFSFMEPLSTEVWMYIVFAYIGVSVVIFLVSRFSPYEWRVERIPGSSGFSVSNDFSVYNCLFFTLAAFMQQGTDIMPKSISGRIASSAWWFFTMIIVSSYTANLAAFLTLEKMRAPIESVEDLAKQTKIKYGIQAGGSTEEFFKFSSVEMYQRMWRFMESQKPSVLTENYAQGIARVRNENGRYAFLLEATANDFHNSRMPCDTMKVGSDLNSIGYGVATPNNSIYKEDINLAILGLQEKGELKKLEYKWWHKKGECDQTSKPTDEHNSSLNLNKVAGVFYILLGGMIASMFAALGEFVYRSRIEARKGNSFPSTTDVSIVSESQSAPSKSLEKGTVGQNVNKSYSADVHSYNTAV